MHPQINPNQEARMLTVLKQLWLDPTRMGEWAIMSFLILISAVAVQMCAPAPAGAEPAKGRTQLVLEEPKPVFQYPSGQVTPEQVEIYIRDWVGFMRDGRRKNAPELSKLAVRLIEEYRVPPWFTVIVMRHESSFHKSGKDGMKGEKGLMQVLFGRVRKMFDMKTSEGQLRAGMFILRLGMSECKNESELFRYYQSGHCDGWIPNLRGRMRALDRVRRGIGRKGRQLW